MVLLNNVFTTVVFEILNVQHLRVRVVVHAGDRGVVRVGNIHDVHVIPTCKIGIRFAVGRGRHLNFGVAGCGQGVEIEKFHVVRTEFVLTGIFVVVAFALNQWVASLHRRVFTRGRLNIVTEDQQRC